MIIMRKKYSILLVGLSLASGGYADDKTSAVVMELDPINVSINKISEDQQTSVSSVTVINAEDIVKKGIKDIDDIAKVLPNTVNGSSYSGVTDWNYRGLNSSAFKGNNPVIVYVDGVAQIGRKSMYVDMNEAYDGYLAYADSQISNDNIDSTSGHRYSAELSYFIDDNSSLTAQFNHNEEDTGYGLIEVLSANDVNSDHRVDELDFNTKTERESESDSQFLRYDYEFDTLRFEGQLTHRNSNYKGVFECDYTSALDIACTENTEIDDIDLELRLVSDSEKLKWVSGLFLGRNDKEIKDNGYNFGGFPLALSEGTHEEKTWAIFGQMNYPITEQWQLTLGARYQQQHYKTDSYYFAAANPQYGISEINSQNRGSEKENSFLPKVPASLC